MSPWLDDYDWDSSGEHLIRQISMKEFGSPRVGPGEHWGRRSTRLMELQAQFAKHESPVVLHSATVYIIA